MAIMCAPASTHFLQRSSVWFLVRNRVPLRVPLKGPMRVLSIRGLRVSIVPVWFLAGNGGMDYGGYYRGHYRDPFPHSLLSTRESL